MNKTDITRTYREIPRPRVFVVADNLVQPARLIEHNAMGCLIEWHISGRRQMVASEQVDPVVSDAQWERACEYGHLNYR